MDLIRAAKTSCSDQQRLRLATRPDKQQRLRPATRPDKKLLRPATSHVLLYVNGLDGVWFIRVCKVRVLLFCVYRLKFSLSILASIHCSSWTTDRKTERLYLIPKYWRIIRNNFKCYLWTVNIKKFVKS